MIRGGRNPPKYHLKAPSVTSVAGGAFVWLPPSERPNRKASALARRKTSAGQPTGRSPESVLRACARTVEEPRCQSARKFPADTSQYQSVNRDEGRSPGTSSPQHIDLLPQDQNFCLKCNSRPQQVDHHSKDQSAQIQHRAPASRDS